MERRKFKRFPVCCPTELAYENAASGVNSITENISAGGALVSTDKPINTKDLVVKVMLKRNSYTVKSKVVHAHAEYESGPYKVGVQFQQTSFDFIKGLFAEIEAINAYRNKLSAEEAREVSLSEASLKWYTAFV